MGIKEVNMDRLEKEIIIAARNIKDNEKVGPIVNIKDTSGSWYSGVKKFFASPETWEILTGTPEGGRLAIEYEVRHWEKDGKKGESNSIKGALRVIQSTDEVKPVVTAPPSPQVDTHKAAQQDLMPKMSCLRAAAEVVTALIGAGQVPDNPTEEVCLKARALYLDLISEWSHA